jgi:hypothetical protein
LCRTGASADAFETVGIDIHEFVGFEERFDLRPVTGEECVIFVSAQITESKMYHPRWRRFCDYPIRKIRIFAANYEIMLPSKFPDL